MNLHIYPPIPIRIHTILSTNCRMFSLVYKNLFSFPLFTIIFSSSFILSILLWNFKNRMYLWKSMLFSHRTCKFGRMSICAAPAWKCIQKHWVHRSSACHLRKPLSKFSILGQINLYYMYIYIFVSRWASLHWKNLKLIHMDWPSSSVFQFSTKWHTSFPLLEQYRNNP